MRTTLTLDDDLAAKLKALAARQKTSFRDVVNEALRRGLTSQRLKEQPARPFRVEPFRGAFRPGVDPLRLNQLSDEIEVQHASDRVRSTGAR